MNINNLNVGYYTSKHQNILIKNIDLSINQPKLIAILGKNGSGKSTLIRTLVQLQPVLGGKIEWFGKDIQHINPLDRSKEIAVLLTDYQHDTLFKVVEIVSLGRMTYTNWLDIMQPEDMQMVEQAIRALNIEDIQNQYYNQLSDGQKQKTMLARAYVQQTPVLLLDEPTAHLDVNYAMELFIYLKKWVSDFQKTIILATHDITNALTLCDEVWVIHNQKLLKGTPQQIIQNQTIAKLFESEHIVFDVASKHFVYKNIL